MLPETADRPPRAPSGPTLSVVLPVKDVAAYLPDMLTSLELNAADVELEVVVVDDGSTDATPDVIAEFAPRLPQVTVLRHEAPVGLADARNAGLDAARGRLVTFLDGDDWIGPGHLRTLVAAIDGLDCDFVRVDHVQVRGRERVTHLAPEARRGVVLDPRSGVLPASRRTMVDYPYAWAGVYRADLGPLLRFPSGLHTAEDRPWIWRLHLQAQSYGVVSSSRLFYRRLVANSLTQIGDARQLHFLDAYEQVFTLTGDERALQAKAVRQYLAVLAHQLKQGRRRFTRPLRHELRTRARAQLARLDPAVLATAVPNDTRQDVLRPLLPPAVLALRRRAAA